MAPISPGRQTGPLRKARKQTQTEKSHRYEPFTKRVAKLKIDPIHNVQQSRMTESSDDISQSYFRAALEEWSELNLTTTFTSFRNEVNGFSESLPQLLYHADQIAKSLLAHIDKQDPLALEALLSLIAHFARDLGQAFEKYFEQTVSLVARVSTAQDDPAVVEACFTCLAWIYKYLSRLLTRDLGPLLRVMRPFFTAKKEHIRRFTAESLAFLMRKTAIMYSKQPQSLRVALKSLFDPLTEDLKDEETTTYAETCKILLVQSAIGTDAALHSSAVTLVDCCSQVTADSVYESAPLEDILAGVVIRLVHETNASGFQPLFDRIVKLNNGTTTSERSKHTTMRLLSVSCATRAGSRVLDWTPVAHVLIRELRESSVLREASPFIPELALEIAAAMIAYAPLGQILGLLNELLTAIIDLNDSRFFFSLCEAVARLDRNRFQDLVLQHLQNYIIDRWATDEDGLVVLLDNLNDLNCLSKTAGKPGFIHISGTWEQSLLKGHSGVEEDSFAYEARRLVLARSAHFPSSIESATEWQTHLYTQVSGMLILKLSTLNLDHRIKLGWMLQTLYSLPVPEQGEDLPLEALLNVHPEAFQLLPFVKALANRQVKIQDVKSNLVAVTAIKLLTKNLLNHSLQLRRDSVQLIHLLTKNDASSWSKASYDLFSEILNTEYSISNARQLAMLIRKLPQLHKNAPADTNFAKMVPYFALGLLPHYHDRLRSDACHALGEMMVDAATEEAVLEILRDWLQAAPPAPFTESRVESDRPDRISSFECTRLNEVKEAVQISLSQLSQPTSILRERISRAHTLCSLRTPSESRCIALEVLLEMPQMAEKRSKILVPAFLAAQRGRVSHDYTLADEAPSVNTLSPEIEERSWSLKERKLFLQLLRCFDNPRVLYRADEVRNILLELLTNGNTEVRKTSLEALLKWRDRSLTAHQHLLLQLAEEKQTTTELIVMLTDEQDVNTLKESERAEVLPVVLRLVFGQLISRTGTHGSQEAKRKNLLRTVFRLHHNEVQIFLDIVLGRLREINLTHFDSDQNFLATDLLSEDQQFGFVRMVLSMLEILQSQFNHFGAKVINAVLYCTSKASRQIDSVSNAESAPALLRSIRRTGLECLTLLFEYCPSLDITPYVHFLHTTLIQPRLQNFAVENSQGVSGLLKLFSSWSRSTRGLIYLTYDENRVLGSCWALLASSLAKPDVKVFVLESLVDTLLNLASTNDIAGAIITAESDNILSSLSSLLLLGPSKELLQTSASTLQRLVPYAKSTSAGQKVFDLLASVLSEPNQRLPPHIKGQILKAIEIILQTQLLQSPYSTTFFELLAGFFNFFRDAPNQQTCARILGSIGDRDPVLTPAVQICQKLTAPSTKGLDEVDHELRTEAFAQFHTELERRTDLRVLLPVANTLIFLLRMSEDTATRGNALSCLKHLVGAIKVLDSDSELMKNTLLVAIRKNLKDDSEIVRADFVELLGAAIANWEDDIGLHEMRSLLVGNDEEASFFTNILHIQQHRRMRAMRRLITEVENGGISAHNIADFFLPLMQQFAEDAAEGDSAQATKGQSIASMTTLLQWLDWKTFRSVFRHYRQVLEQRKDDDKIDTRLLNHAADALVSAVQKRNLSQNDLPMPHLARTLPATEVIEQELKTNFITKLAELSHYRDEGEISQRIPAAVVAIKLIKLLPENDVSILAAPIVLDIAQVLRSRTQQTRDMARNKLAEAVCLLGSSSLQFVLKELRTALTRGYQLHVLSYTLHTILLKTAEQRGVGDLDYCIEDVVKVILDDAFGVVGHEKENQDYISTMKEVKSNKSFDSMEILARCTSVSHLYQLVLPFESLLTGTLTSKQTRHVDELFRRIGVGISHNPAAKTQDLLVFAFQLIQSFYRARPSPPMRQLTNDEKNRARFIVQKDNVGKVGSINSTSLTYKLAKFAIDMARSTFARHAELMTPENVTGFVPIIGDALLEAQEDVKISALRLLATVIRLDLPQFDENAKLYVMEAVRVVKGAISTNEEAAQAALKVVAAIIRDKSNAEVRESDIAYLLKRTMPDLEEPDRQGLTFNFIKALMARKIQIPEVYELVDKLGLMMVTSQSRASRDAARGVYVHFLLDYPQAKTRWSKQVKFMVKNLEYQYPEGRQSVMEAISTLLTKIDKSAAKEFAAVIFVPVILRMANDENERCREMAAALLSQLFQRTSSESTFELLRTWLEQDDNVVLRNVSLQAWAIYFKSVPESAHQELDSSVENVWSILQGVEADSSWESTYHALELLRVLVNEYPERILVKARKELWNTIAAAHDQRHPWIQNSAAALFSSLFHDCVKAGNTTIPLTTKTGLSMTEEDVVTVLRSSIKILKHQSTSTELSNTVIENVVFLSRVVDASDTRLLLKEVADEVEDVTDDEEVEQDDIGVSDRATNRQSDKQPSIPAIQYVIDQAARTLRREPPKQTSTALRPKLSFLNTQIHLIPNLKPQTFKQLSLSLTTLFVPLLHLTNPSTPAPRSTDPSFTTTYTTLIEQSHLLLEALQAVLGDQTYMQHVTSATKIARERRQERRQKRDIGAIAEPARAAREKRRKTERKGERRKEIKGMFRSGRRRDLGF